MQRSPSVPSCSESSWHLPFALQLGLRPENDVLPFLSRPVWQSAHATFLCFLTSGKLPPGPWTSSTILLSLPCRIVGSPACTLACAWQPMHWRFGSKSNFSKSFGPLPRWQRRHDCSACLYCRLNLVR